MGLRPLILLVLGSFRIHLALLGYTTSKTKQKRPYLGVGSLNHNGIFPLCEPQLLVGSTAQTGSSIDLWACAGPPQLRAGVEGYQGGTAPPPTHSCLRAPQTKNWLFLGLGRPNHHCNGKFPECHFPLLVVSTP